MEWARTADIGGDRRAEFVGPASNSLIADVDAAFSKQTLDIPKAHRETVVEPHCQPDYIRREPMALVGNGFHVCLSYGSNATNRDKLAFA